MKKIVKFMFFSFLYSIIFLVFVKNPVCKQIEDPSLKLSSGINTQAETTNTIIQSVTISSVVDETDRNYFEPIQVNVTETRPVFSASISIPFCSSYHITVQFLAENVNITSGTLSQEGTSTSSHLDSSQLNVESDKTWSQTLQFLQNNPYSTTDKLTLSFSCTGSPGNTFNVLISRDAPNNNTNLEKISYYDFDSADLDLLMEDTNASGSSSMFTTIHVPYSCKKLHIIPELVSNLSTSNIKLGNTFSNATEYTDGVYTFNNTNGNGETVKLTITVTSQANTKKTYYREIVRDPANQERDITLSTAKYTYLDINGVSKEGTVELKKLERSDSTEENRKYFYGNDEGLPYTAKSITFTFAPKDNSKVYYFDKKTSTARDITNIETTLDLSFYENTGGLTNQFIIVIYSEKDQCNGNLNPAGTPVGNTFYFDVFANEPEKEKNITEANLIYTSDSSTLAPTSSPEGINRIYTFEMMRKAKGSQFKLQLAWEGDYTKVYMYHADVENLDEIATDANRYNPDKIWELPDSVSLGQSLTLYAYAVSQNGGFFRYSIEISPADERSTNNGITSIEFKDKEENSLFTYHKETLEYDEIEVPYRMNSVHVTITLEDDVETLVEGPNFLSAGTKNENVWTFNLNLEEGVNTFYIQGKSEKEVEGNKYTFYIKRIEGRTENSVTDIIINDIRGTDSTKTNLNFDHVFSPDDASFSFYFPRSSTSTFIDINLNIEVSLGATYTINKAFTLLSTNEGYSGTLDNGKKISFTLLVKSEVEDVNGGSGRTYSLNVYCADFNASLTDIKLLAGESLDSDSIKNVSNQDFQFRPENETYDEFIVPYKVSRLYVHPVKTIDTISFAWKNSTKGEYSLNVGTNTIEFEARSELALLAEGDEAVNRADAKKKYILPIRRQDPSDDATLKSLSVKIDGEEKSFSYQREVVEFSPTQFEYHIEYVDPVSATIEFAAEKNYAEAQLSLPSNLSISLQNSISQTWQINVRAENGTTQSYSVTLWTTRANPDTNNKISYIKAFSSLDENQSEDILAEGPFIDTKTSYTVQLVYKANVNLQFSKESEYSKLYIICDNQAPHELTKEEMRGYPISLDTNTNDYLIKVYAVSESQEKGQEYSISISKEKDRDATLKKFTVNGETVKKQNSDGSLTDFVPGDTANKYLINIPYTTTAVSIDIVPTSEKVSSCLLTSGSLTNLSVGENKIYYTVVAEDDSSNQVYQLVIIRDEDFILNNVSATYMYKEEEFDVTFNPSFTPSGKNYTLEVPYEATQIKLVYESLYNTAIILKDTTRIESESNEFILDSLVVGDNNYIIQVVTASKLSQDVYHITITRKPADSDATLNSLVIHTPTEDFTVDEFVLQSDGSYLATTIYVKDAETAFFEGKLNKKTSIISQNPYDSSTNSLSLQIGQQEIEIVTLAQDETTSLTYRIPLFKDAPRIIEDLSIKASEKELISSFDDQTLTYTIALEYTESLVSFSFTNPYDTYNTVKLFKEDQEITTLDHVDIAIDESIYTIKVISKRDETILQNYTITFNRDDGSDVGISSYKYQLNPDSMDLEVLDDITDVNLYLVNREQTNFNPEITLSDPKAHLDMPAEEALIPGQANERIVRVTSQNGTPKEYKFVVFPCDNEYSVNTVTLKDASGNLIKDADNANAFIDINNGILNLKVVPSLESVYLDYSQMNSNATLFIKLNSNEEFVEVNSSNQEIPLEKGMNTIQIYGLSELGKAYQAYQTKMRSSLSNTQSEVVTLQVERLENPQIHMQITKNGTMTTKTEDVIYGESFSFALDLGYNITSITIDDEPITGEYKESYLLENVIDNHTISIIYGDPHTYRINLSIEGQGKVLENELEITDNYIDYIYDTTRTLAFEPQEGYVLGQVMVDGVAITTLPQTVTIIPPNTSVEGFTIEGTKEHTISIRFDIIKYEFHFTLIGVGGSIFQDGIEIINEPIEDKVIEYEYGSMPKFLFSALPGYQIKSVTIDSLDQSKLGSYNPTVYESHTIVVEFEERQYEISVIISSGASTGSVSPEGDLEYKIGSNATYQFIPAIGYEVDFIRVDGTEVSDGALADAIEFGYVFNNITTTHTLVVGFRIKTFELNVFTRGNGTVSEVKEKYEYGESETLILDAADGCHIESIRIDGLLITDVNAPTHYELNLNSIEANHSIDIVFKGDTTVYKLYHRYQKIDSQEYDSPVLIAEVEAEVFEVVQPYATTVIGFEAQPVLPFVIQKENNECIITYDRKTFSISFSPNVGAILSGDGEYPYGKEIEISAEVRTGYRWNQDTDIKFRSNKDSLPSSTSNPYRFTVPAENVQFTVEIIPYFTIDVKPAEYGLLDVTTGIYEFLTGDSFTINYTPYTGYKVSALIIDNEEITNVESNQYIFENINENHTFEVRFEQITYHIDTTIQGTTATFREEHIFAYGTNYSYSLTPIEGYEIINMVVDGTDMGKISEYTFQNIQEDHHIEVNIRQITFTLFTNIRGNGSVSPEENPTVTYGSDRVINFVPDIGYQVEDVAVDGVSVGAVEYYLFESVSANHRIDVLFTQITCTIQINNPEHGRVIYNGTLTIPYGSNKTLEFIPDEGYQISHIQINHENIGKPSTYAFLNIQEDQNVQVEFEQIMFTFEVHIVGKGQVNPSGDLIVPYGSNQTINLIPDEGFRISRVAVDGEVQDINPTLSFNNVKQSHIIAVEFSQLTYTITVNVHGNGSINLEPTTIVNWGESKTLVLTPNYGQRIKSILIDNVSQPLDNEVELNSIQKNYVISIEFEQITHTMTIVQAPNGSITPAETHSVNYGSTETYAFVPNEGYRVKRVIVDGKTVEATNAYTFDEIIENHQISVEFEEITHVITVLCGENGTANVDAENIVQHLSNLICRFTPNEGYQLRELFVDDISLGNSVSVYYFGNISTDHKIEAIFEQIEYSMSIYFDPNGTVTYETENGAYVPEAKTMLKYGANYALNIIPAADYVAKIWINGEQVETQTKLSFENIQQDYTIQINFVRLLHLDITKEGKGTVPESVSYEWMTPVTFVFTPEVGNKVKEVLVDNQSVGAVSNYSFPALVSNHSIQVIFEPIIYSINYTIHGQGEVSSLESLKEVTYGSSRTLDLTPLEGWELTAVFINGEETKMNNNEYTFDSVDQDVEIVVYFTEIPQRAIPLWVFIVLGVIILILIILLIIISVWNKKRKLYRYSK